MPTNFIVKSRARAAFKTVKNYGYATCISINNEAVHGVPSRKRRIAGGDLVKVDVGIALNGYFSDACSTFPAGEPGEAAMRLLQACRQSLDIAIGMCVPGAAIGDLGHAISGHGESRGFAVVKKFAGHGIGFALHEAPVIPHYGVPGSGLRIPAGLVFALEPVMNAGSEGVVPGENRWTQVTADGSLSAQFEHTIAVTENGPLVLTA